MGSKRNKLADRAVCLLVRTFSRIVSLIPRPVAYFLCETIASLVYLLDRKHRKIGMINLGIAFPAASQRWRRRILHQSFRQLGTHAVEMCRLHRMPPDELIRRVSYDQSFEYYLKAREENKGLIFLTAHLGCWELISTTHSANGYRLNVLVRPLDNPCLDQWMSEGRSRFGTGIIQKTNALRQMLSLLKDKQEIGILLDQNVQEKDGVYAPLFGRPASTSVGLAAIVMKTGCPVIAAFIMPGPRKGTFVINMSPPIRFLESGDRKKDLEVNTAAYNRHLEEAIRKYPQGWLWGHRRFKTQPGGGHPYV